MRHFANQLPDSYTEASAQRIPSPFQQYLLDNMNNERQQIGGAWQEGLI